MIVRKEEPQDSRAITRVIREAFAGEGEAYLVEALRQNDKITLSLVAVADQQVVGHILFSPMRIVSHTGSTHEVVGLGPLAVLPENQKQGIGSALCEKGVAMCRDAGHQAVLVLGHPTYYPRFGFQPASLYQISCAYDVPAEAFMALELQEGALSGMSGVAHYQSEFDGV